jgi:hypothetical protein
MRSHTARQKLAVAYTDNPHVDGIDLTGEIEFPNLVLERQVGPDRSLCQGGAASGTTHGGALIFHWPAAAPTPRPLPHTPPTRLWTLAAS